MSDDRRQDPRRALGATGEQLAAEHLERRGFAILERNYRTRWGELDIIATDGLSLIFCEVKTRQTSHNGRDPLESVHPRKRNQVRRMAGRWLVERRDRPRVDELRFDAIGVTLDPDGRLVRLDHLEGAF
jgi:putative endonuclease